MNRDGTQHRAKSTSSVGLLLPASIIAATLAAILHHVSALPAGYTWQAPLNILRGVAQSPRLPTAGLIVWLIGSHAAGVWSLRGVLRNLRAQQDRSVVRRLAIGGLSGVTLVAIASYLCPAYDTVDFLSLMVVGLLGAFRKADRRTALVALGSLLVMLLVFTLVSYSFTVFKALLFVHRQPHDQEIAAFERAIFGVNPHRLVAEALRARPWLLSWCDDIYFWLFEHMVLTSVFLIGLQRVKLRTEFLSALAVCYIIGGLSYYVYPALGPVYLEPQLFTMVHENLPRTTYVQRVIFLNTREAINGGSGPLQTYSYIAAMPSLHLAHELVMLWYARHSWLAFGLSLVFTSATFLVVMGLGWHYAVDAIGGALLALIAIAFVHWQRDRLFPRALVAEHAVPSPPRVEAQ